MNIRQATRADDQALCDLERRSPLRLGDTALYVDRGDFFAAHDVQDRAVVMLAEEDGRLLGVCAGALNEAPLAGKKRLLLYIHHERIDPEQQRRGIGGALTRACADYWKERDVGFIDSSYWMILADNEASLSFANRGGREPWPVRPVSMAFDAVRNEEPPRRIGAGPIFDIVRLINRTHRGKQLFNLYEQVDFGRRLSRTFDYGWGDVYGRYRDGRLVAVAGVWDRGRLTCMRSSPDDPGYRPWAIADWGFEEGAEAEMAALVGGICGLAVGAGRGRVNMFVDRDEPIYEALSTLPNHPAAVRFYAPRIEPPAELTPLYIDPFLF